jgi:hypothetical protein
MPPALQDWLPEGDLAWFILDAGAPMKLGAIERTYRTDGWEQAAYEPAMLVARAVCRRPAPCVRKDVVRVDPTFGGER